MAHDLVHGELISMSRGRCHAAVAMVCALALAGSGCTSSEPKPPESVSRLPFRNSALPVRTRTADLLSRMGLEEKVGQMTVAERSSATGQVNALGLGGVLSAGGSVPEPNTPAAWADMVDAFQREALTTRLGIPVLYGVDAVHGHGNLLGATVFPHDIGLGATRDPALVEEVYRVTAQETRATGPQWVFAPCLCVARDDRWGRTYESFGEDPRLVTQMETAIDGLQGPPGRLADPGHVLATAKHFAGDGSTRYGTGEGDFTIDRGVAVQSRAEFRRVALRPYVDAVGAHQVGAVMPSYSSVDWTDDGTGNPVKMHADRELVTGVLEQQWGFDGIVVSDYDAVEQLPGDFARQVRTAVNAGVDLFLEGDQASRFVDTLVAEVRAGRVPTARIDDAVSRILRAKFELGLFEHPLTDRRNLGDVGSAAHRRLARRAAAESQVLLKNAGAALPVAPGRPVYVAGRAADDIGGQAGGWTLTWQGSTGDIVPGSSILDGIRALAGSRAVTWSEDASAEVPADAVGVVVVGETPYAEGYGDVGAPPWTREPLGDGSPRPAQTMRLGDADRALVTSVCARATSCVLMLVSGRPIVLEPALLDQVDALVAAWLPGSEGTGVADPLLGRTPYSGRLPVSWPRSLAQEPVNVGDRDYDPLFRYGYGLTTRPATR